MAADGSSSLWQKTKTGSKAGFDKLWSYADKLGAPVNRLSNKLGSESFWPTTLDKESEKAARILRSFCKDGFYEEKTKETEDGPKRKQHVLVKIPSEVIRNAKGIAIFTTMRTGLWFSGAGGSGIVVARKEDGTWSPPAGIMLHTAGLGFLIGVDIYDCVLVLNTQEALDAFTKVRCTVGGEISAVAGPVGAGGVLDSEVHARQAPIFTYLKSRGFYAGVQIDGTVMIERTDENARFYGREISTKEILGGATHSPVSLKGLVTTLKAAQGDAVDENDLPSEPPPADFQVEQNGHVFGIPDREDPDPFGVAALSREGMEVKDATTHSPAPESEFEFRPRQNSVAWGIINRQGADSPTSPSKVADREGHVRYGSMDHSTQTDLDAEPIKMDDNEAYGTPKRHSRGASDLSGTRGSMEEVSLSESPQDTKPLFNRGPPPKLPPRNRDAGHEESPAVTDLGVADFGNDDDNDQYKRVPANTAPEPDLSKPEAAQTKDPHP